MRDKLLTHALLKAYDTLLMKGRFPAAVLYLELPYGYVDVNVHPAKTEVRFRRQSEIYETVLSAVRGALQSAAEGGPLPLPGHAPDPGALPAPAGVREPVPDYRGAAVPPGLDLGSRVSSPALAPVGAALSGPRNPPPAPRAAASRR